MTVACPICGNPAASVETRWGTRHECCGLRSWNGKPLVSQETLNARIYAHRVFDRLWQSGKIARGEAYRRLSNEMKLRPCHIGDMTLEQARLVPEAVRSIEQDINFNFNQEDYK